MPSYLSLAALQKKKQQMNWVLEINFCAIIFLLVAFMSSILSSFVFMTSTITAIYYVIVAQASFPDVSLPNY